MNEQLEQLLTEIILLLQNILSALKSHVINYITLVLALIALVVALLR